jgi:hypothetical protein
MRIERMDNREFFEIIATEEEVRTLRAVFGWLSIEKLDEIAEGCPGETLASDGGYAIYAELDVALDAEDTQT